MPPKAPTALHAHCVPSLRCPPAWAWALAGLAAGGAPSWAQSPAISATQLPQGGKVVAGTASINQSGNNLQINQSSNRAVLDWNSFNVGAQAQVNFAQPSASSVTLNRVLDTQASQIMGRITANGQVFLTNPNGVLFGPTAQVDVGGLLVTTHGIGNDDFMAGKSSFEGAGAAGSVVNQGQLQASLGGYIAMLAPLVRNEGVIVAKEGTVALAAGDKITLQFAGQSLTAVQVDRAVMDALVDNQHLVRAEGGYVVMTARSANALLQNVVKNTGSVQAPSLVNRQGRIVLEGGSLGRVEVAGSLSATGDSGQSGGSVVVMGDQVQLSSGARIDASGDTGGGQVLIGGGWGAQVGPVGKSSSVSLGEGVNIKAAATGTGNGGYVETSAQKVQIAASARLDTSAANGKAGQWVIDPVDITIDDSLASAISSALGSGDVTVSTDGNNTPNTIAGESSGTGNININSPITWSANMLTLRAADKIFINQILRGSGSAHLRFALPDPGGLDKIFLKAPTYLAEGDNASFLFPGTGVVSIKVITRLGLSGSVSGLDLQGINGNLSGVYFLGDDIDASATSTWQGGAGFMPLGNNATPFSGSFFGGGHTIRNLTINRPADDAVGLLGNSMGSASEVGLINASVTGANHVGALVGRLSGPGSVSTSFSTGTVRGQTSVGGLVGTLDGSGEVRNSYAKANVSVYNFADAGGLIGLVNAGTVYKTYATGAVTVVGSGPSSGIGGLIGRLGSGGSGALDVVHAGFWDTTLSGQSTSAAGIGLATAATQRFNNGLDQFELNPNYWQNYYNKTTPLLAAFLTPITVNAGSDSKTYDGRAYTSNTGFSTSISVSGSDPYFLGGGDYYYKQGTTRVSPVNAGSYSIVPDLYSSDNRGYNITVVNGTLTVNPADVSLSGSRVYDGSTAMAGANLTATGVNGETFRVTGSGASGNLASKQVQTAQPLASVNGLSLGTSDNGGLSSNYHSLSTANSSVTVTPKAVTLTAPVASKTYDATTAYTPTASDLSALSSQLGVDGDSVSDIGLSFNNKNAAAGTKVLSASGAIISDGNGGQNYSISYASNSNSTIIPKALAISGITAADKVYDGLTSATVSTAGVTSAVLQANGMLAGDTVTVSAMGNFRNADNTANDKNVGSGKTVALTSTFGGADVANYAITPQATTTASISPKALTIGGITAADKVYDGLSTATVSTTGVTNALLQANGMVTGDTIIVLATGQFRNADNTANDKNVGVAKTVLLSSSHAGADVANYTITPQATTTASITPKAVTLTAPVASKTYDATTAYTPSASQLSELSRQLGVDGDSVSGIGLSFNNKNAAIGNKVLSASGAIISDGNGGQNYSISYASNSNSTINPKSLAVTGLIANSKSYDGTTDVNLSGTATIAPLAGDSVSLQSGSAQFLRPTEGSNVPVTASGFQISGADAANYQLVQPAGLSAHITPMDLTATRISLSPAAMTTLTRPQLALLSPDQVGYLSTAQLSALSPAQLSYLNPSVWSRVSTSSLGSLTNDQIASLTASAWSYWLASQVRALSPSQLQAISASQMAGWTRTQLQALDISQWVQISDLTRQSLSAAQIETLTPAQIGNWPRNILNDLSESQWAGLGVRQIAGMTRDQISAMSPSRLALWSSAQLSALSAVQMAWMSMAQINALNPTQLRVLADNGLLQYVVGDDASRVQVSNTVTGNAQSSTQLSVSNSDAASSSSVSATTLSASSTSRQSSNTQALMVVTSERQISQLSGQQVQSLSVAQLRLMNGTQLDALVQSHSRALLATQWASLSAQQLASLSPSVWASLGRDVLQSLSAQQLSLLTLSQVQAMRAEQLQALSVAQLEVFNRVALSALSETQFKALVSNKLAALSSEQIQSISTAQWLSLSRSQIQSLTLQQIQSLSAAQLSAMSAAQWQSLSAEQVQMLVPQNLTNVNVAQLAIVLKWLNPSQISALDPRTVAQFSVPLLTSLSPLQWAALQAQQIAALSLAQLNALSPTQFRSLGSTALTELSAQQIASLSPALLSALSRVQWQSLSPSQLQGLQSSQLAALSVAQLESLGPQVLQALAPNQLVGLSLAQLQVVQAASGNWPVQAMSPAQINAMDAAQVQALSVDSIGLLTPPQIAAFNALQLQALSLSQWQAMTPTQWAALQASQLLAVPASVWRDLSLSQVAALGPAQWRVLPPSVVRAFTANQLQALSPTTMTAMTPAQWNALTPEQLNAFTPTQVAAMPVQWLGQLQPRQIQLLSAVQTGALTPAQVAVLNGPQIQILTPAQVEAINPVALTQLSPAQLAALSPIQLTALKPQQINALAPAQMRALTPAQVKALQPNQMAALQAVQLNAFTPAQIQALSPGQIQALGPAQIVAVNPEQLQWLSPAQWNGLRTDAVPALGPAQLQALGPNLIAAFNGAQINALQPQQMGFLLNNQVAALSTAQIWGLSNAQLQALSPAQISAIRSVNLGTLLPLLKVEQIQGLSKVQLASVNPNQLRQLNNAQAQALLSAR